MSVTGKLASEMIKFIGEFGITATKKRYGTGKAGVGGLSDEQLGKGLNTFQAKKDEKQALKNKPKTTKKKKPKSPPRDTEKSATQRGLRFKDKPEVDIEVESNASRSVSETNLVRGAGSAGRSTNAPGRTNIGSMSMTNFIKDAMANYGVVQKRNKIDKEFQRRINEADTKEQKDRIKKAWNKVREQRTAQDVKDQQATSRKISAGLRGKKRQRRTDYVTQDGEIIGKPTQEQIKAAMRNAEARDDTKTAKRMRDALEELRGVETGSGQVQSAGTRKLDASDRMIQSAKNALIAVFGEKKGTEIFNRKLRGATTKQQFLVEIRSMVRGNSQGQRRSHSPGETGAVVGERKSRLQLVDRSANKQPGRREVTSRRGKSGNSEVDAPMNRGGKVTKRMIGAHDYRMNKGGLLLSSVDNRKKR